MKRFLHRMWREDDGVLTFEWVLIITIVVIGIVGGLAAARDGIIDELGDIAEATISFDQSYFIPAMDLNDDGDTDDPGEAEQFYEDEPAEFFDCQRGNFVAQPTSDDALDGG